VYNGAAAGELALSVTGVAEASEHLGQRDLGGEKQQIPHRLKPVRNDNGSGWAWCLQAGMRGCSGKRKAPWLPLLLLDGGRRFHCAPDPMRFVQRTPLDACGARQQVWGPSTPQDRSHCEPSCSARDDRVTKGTYTVTNSRFPSTLLRAGSHRLKPVRNDNLVRLGVMPTMLCAAARSRKAPWLPLLLLDGGRRFHCAPDPMRFVERTPLEAGGARQQARGPSTPQDRFACEPPCSARDDRVEMDADTIFLNQGNLRAGRSPLTLPGQEPRFAQIEFAFQLAK